MKYFDDIEPFCKTLNQRIKKAGFSQYELGQVLGFNDKSEFNRKLHNDRGLNFGPVDEPEEFVPLFLWLVVGKTQTGIPSGISNDKELDELIDLLPSCLASAKGKLLVKERVLAQIVQWGIPWNREEVITESKIPAIEYKRSWEMQFLLDTAPDRDQKVADDRNAWKFVLWLEQQILKFLHTNAFPTAQQDTESQIALDAQGHEQAAQETKEDEGELTT